MEVGPRRSPQGRIAPLSPTVKPPGTWRTCVLVALSLEFLGSGFWGLGSWGEAGYLPSSQGLAGRQDLLPAGLSSNPSPPRSSLLRAPPP